jgi:hypothetical protein
MSTGWSHLVAMHAPFPVHLPPAQPSFRFLRCKPAVRDFKLPTLDRGTAWAYDCPMSAAARRVYDLHVRTLPRGVQLELLAVIASEAAQVSRPSGGAGLRELAGLGSEVWAGVDADAYVHALRDEWDRRR